MGDRRSVFRSLAGEETRASPLNLSSFHLELPLRAVKRDSAPQWNDRYDAYSGPYQCESCGPGPTVCGHFWLHDRHQLSNRNWKGHFQI